MSAVQEPGITSWLWCCKGDELHQPGEVLNDLEECAAGGGCDFFIFRNEPTEAERLKALMYVRMHGSGLSE